MLENYPFQFNASKTHFKVIEVKGSAVKYKTPYERNWHEVSIPDLEAASNWKNTETIQMSLTDGGEDSGCGYIPWIVCQKPQDNISNFAGVLA